jgi:membrane-associated phospholipid phosphatase
MSAEIKREAKLRYAAAAFCTLLVLSVFWPSPLVSINRLWIGTSLGVDELSFLGREAPSWDVVFWCIAGLLLLAIVQSAGEEADPRQAWRRLRALRLDRSRWRRAAIAFGLGLSVGTVATAAVWRIFDQPVLAWAEGVQSERIEDVIRILNRLGGGMNPVIIVLFFLVAGVAYVERRWISYAIGMGIAGLSAGIVAQIVKHLVNRARPELWLGPSQYAASSTSFPSGHTVGAFALAGILLWMSPSVSLRIVAFLLATGVGLARILAFRHWASDVFASAAIGLLMAWIVAAAIDDDSRSAYGKGQ